MGDNIIDMNINDFNKKFPNTNLIKIGSSKIGYDDIIETIINDYRKCPFDINIENITNIPNMNILNNEKLWEDLIKIENLILRKIDDYFNNSSIETIKSFIFLYYNDIFDCLKDFIIKNNNEIDIRLLDKKSFYLKLVGFSIFFNTNIYNDVYDKLKKIILNNKLIII